VGDLGEGSDDDADAELDALEEFWVKKAVAEGLVDTGSELDAWWSGQWQSDDLVYEHSALHVSEDFAD
jgi:hypothetical protein